MSSFYDKVTENRIDTKELLKILKKENLLIEGDEAIIKSYDKYKALLFDEKKVDFASLQTMLFDFLKNNETVLNEVQEKYKYILVDEYQDTSPLQDRIFRLIAGKNKNLFVVGDVKQSIYGFRGATVINFEKFTDRYPEAKTYFLNVNFRSTKNIVELSNKVFEDVVKRELESRRRHGEKIRLLYGENSDQTAKKTLKTMGI
jgi:DNA helicase-2/ATP-dependent DNA helicase PcrA